MKKNNTAQKTALEVEKISKALKEGTEKTLKNLIKEAIEDIVDTDEKEVEKEDEPIEDDSFEVQDVETVDEPTDEPVDEPAEEPAEEGEEAEPEADDAEGDEAEDEWGDLEDFKVGDNEYDFTGVDGDIALKVYNKLGDDDQINVKKEDDGTYTVTDDETGAELVIELEPGGGEGAEEDADAEPMDSEEPVEDEEPMDDDEEQIEIDLGDDEPGEDELNEDLGYTTDYQKDVMPGLNMNEPADKKTTNTWDEGVPQGNKRPWPGKGESKPFEKKVNEGCHEEVCGKCGKEPCECEKEIDEAATTVSQQPARKETMSQHKQHRPESPAEVVKVDSPKTLSESKAKQILEAAKAIQAENKQLKNALHEQAQLVQKCKQSLLEAATLNVNYGKIVNLLVNESTTKAEKQSIIERFSNVNTIKEGAMLYESIKRELNESNKKNAANVLNEQISAEPSKTINETPIYTENASLKLMERMENLSKNYSRGNSFTAKGNNASVQLMERMEKLGKR